MNVTIYTKPHCNYCVMAKQFLQSAGIPYNEAKLDVHFEREQLVAMYPNAQTYPVVVVDGYHIGGANELEQYLLEHKQDNTQILNEG